jgi:putative transposase
MKVSQTGYYKSLLPKPPQPERPQFDELVREEFYKNRRSYGTRRIQKQLRKKSGVSAGRRRIAASMKRQGLVTTHRKLWKAPRTTDSSETVRIAPNLLAKGTNRPTKPGTVLAGDITYLRRTNGEFFHLATVTDLFTWRIVGWSLRADLTANIVTEALGRAVAAKYVKSGAIVHTDRGSQYASDAYLKLIEKHGLLASMSRKENCWDNAWSESVFATIKKELIENGEFDLYEDALAELVDWIDNFYNTERLHSSLGYMSPAEFERHYQKTIRPTADGLKAPRSQARLQLNY